MTDDELEAKIREAEQRCLLAVKTPEYIAAWKDLVALIGQRSPGQVAKMEREKGIA